MNETERSKDTTNTKMSFTAVKKAEALGSLWGDAVEDAP